MKVIPLTEAREDIFFYNVYGMYQKWCNKKNSFSYMTIPRPYHGFMHVMCEKVVITLKNGEKHTFENGNIIYIPKGLCYLAEFFGSVGEQDSMLINFNMEDKNGEFVFCNNVTKLVGTSSARYTDDFRKIIERYAGTVNDSFSIMSAFYNLLNNLALHQGKKKLMENEYNIVAPAIMYMDNHVNENTSVPELAKMCLVSETCFRRYFKMCTGMTPSNYKMKSKIQKAIKMLKTDTITATEIVSELNFYDLSYFYKMFKKETGMTPAEYIQKDEF